jgi:hypothetical protein
MDFAWQAAPPRRCIGRWHPHTRRQLRCPHRQPLADTAPPQCAACAAADPGRALAQDRADGDTRDFVLYLAWFGGDLFKVGITAADRGTDRLAEQGAIAFTSLARGPFTHTRTAEHRAALAGFARERVSWPAKIAQWWALPDAAARHELVTAAHTRIQHAADWPATLEPLPCRIIDQVTRYGLDGPAPRSYRRLTHIRAHTRLAGRVTAIVGRQLLLDAGRAGHVLADLRMSAGWHPSPGTVDAPDLELGQPEHPNTGDRCEPDTLF